MTKHKTWLLKLVLPFRYGHLLTALLLLSILVPFFHLAVDESGELTNPALFFSLIIAYIIPVFSYITARAREALLELRPILTMDEEAFADALARLDSTSLRPMLLQLGGGMLLGFAHLGFIRGSYSSLVLEFTSSPAALISYLGALLVWVVMTTVMSMLVRQAILFARLGKNEVRISLLATRKLVPFARVAIVSSLAIIGALALFPLMRVDSDMDLAAILPGAIATLVPLLVMFIIPVWPVHKRIAAMKAEELASLEKRIEVMLEGRQGCSLETAKLQQLAPLLEYRREIVGVSTWPFDTGAVTRLLLYLIIPPLTWAGAALIENLVDSLL